MNMSILTLTILATFLIFINVIGAITYPASDPKNTLGWTPYWSMWDEFNGNTLNTAKWVAHSPELHNYFWYYGRQPGLVSKENVKLANGRLYLYATKDKPISQFYKDRGFDTFTVSMVHSKTKLKYGYSEIKAKVGTSRISSSFWFWGKTETDATEIDVFEQSGPVNALKEGYYQRLHANRYIHKLNGVAKKDLPAKCNCAFGNGDVCHDTPIGNTWGRDDIRSFSDDWHIYGMHWTSTKIKIYVDGELVITMNNDCNKYPMWLFFNRATMPQWFGVPPKSDVPDQPFQIEYVRTWTQTGKSYTEEGDEVDGGLNGAEIASVVIVALGVVICICVGVFCYKRKKRLGEEIKLEDNKDKNETVVNDEDGYDMSPVVTPGDGDVNDTSNATPNSNDGNIDTNNLDGDDDEDPEIEIDLELEMEDE